MFTSQKQEEEMGEMTVESRSTRERMEQNNVGKAKGGDFVCVCEPVYFPQTSVGDGKRGRAIMLREMEEVRHDGYIVMGHNDSVQYVRIISAL